MSRRNQNGRRIDLSTSPDAPGDDLSTSSLPLDVDETFAADDTELRSGPLSAGFSEAPPEARDSESYADPRPLREVRRSAAAGATPARKLNELLRRRWRPFSLIVAEGILIAWIITAMQPPRYRAETIAAVMTVSGTLTPTEVFRGVEVLDGRNVVATIAALAPLRLASGGHEYAVTSVVLPNTNLIRIQVEGTSARGTVAAAGSVVEHLGGQTRALFRYYNVATVAAASVSREPVYPRTERALAVGAAVGVLVGLAAVWAREKLRAGTPKQRRA